MAGYYNKNKDYSLAIKQAQQSGASQAEISRLQQERQNKIDAQYGGRDPYKGSSNIMGNASSTSRPIPSRPSSGGGYSRPSYSGGYTPQRPSNSYPAPAAPKTAQDYLNSGRGDYSLAIKQAQQSGASADIISQLQAERAAKIQAQYGGRDPYKGTSNIMGAPVAPGSSKPVGSIFTTGVAGQANMIGGPAYANGRYNVGDWTYIFDERGRQTGKVKDYGASATGPMPIDPSYINRSEAHRKAYEAAARGDLDSVGHWLGEISHQGGLNEHGTYDMTEANAYGEMLNAAFPKGFNNFYRNQYDSIYGAGAWDDPNHHGANLGNIDPGYAAMAEANRHNGTVLPAAPLGSLPGFVPGGSFFPGDLVPGGGYTPGGFGGGSTGSTGSTGSRMEDYLRQLAQAKKDAQEAALRASYQQGQANLQAHAGELDSLYSAQRNQAAAQRELEQLRLNEMGLAHGLNTGAYGQLAAGQSAAYLSALAGLGEKEAADRAALDMQLQQMTNKFQTDLAQGSAQTDAWLYDQLYNEYIRQQEAEEQRRQEWQKAEAQRQREWREAMYRRQEAEAKRQQELYRQQQMQTQMQAQEKAKAEAAAHKAAVDRAKLLAAYGDFSGYAALGYTPKEIAFLERGYAAQHAKKRR